MFEESSCPDERALDDVAGGSLLLVLDATSGVIRYLSSAAAHAFGLPAPGLERPRARDLLPELEDLTPRTFESRLATPDGERRGTVRLEYLSAEPDIEAGAVVVSIAFHEPIAGPDASHLARLESLWRLVVRGGMSAPEHNRAILREALRGLRFERVSLDRVVGDELVPDVEWPVVPNRARAPLAGSLGGAAVRDARGRFELLDARLDPGFSALAGEIGSGVAAAFRVGEQSRMLTFTSPAARRQPFGDADWRYLEHVAEALARDLERHAADERLRRLAYTDALTSLPNRLSLLDRLDAALAESKALGCRAGVLFLDIDGFKAVNDTVGHRGGDGVLAEIARRLRGALRHEESIGRLGGDEFAFVVPRVSGREAIESLAQRVLAALAPPVTFEANRFALSASVGVALYPDDALERDALLAAADAAMYGAKGEGGSRVRYGSPATTLADQLSDAGYVLCYQPILELATGRVAGAEALLRRVHPTQGLLGPERGLPLGRDDDGRRALDRWVLREATVQARAWSLDEQPIQVDVNLAAFDIGDLDALLGDGALGDDVRRLRVEVGAGQLADRLRAGQLAAYIERGSSKGMTFALDGFNAGEAALALEKLPIEAIKLERSLVERVASNRTVRAVVEGTINVARTLSWSVTAKGVETLAQQKALEALGCDAVQGFYVAHPMTAVDFSAWLRDRRYSGPPL